MYLKVKQNKEKYQAYIDKRRAQNKANVAAAEEFIGLSFTQYYSSTGFNCVNTIDAIIPKNKDYKMPDGWKISKEDPTAIEPNLRTKKGREASEFLLSLKNWSFYEEMEVIGVSVESANGRFKLPYIGEFNGEILISLDENHEPECMDDFEIITGKKFQKLAES